MPVSLTASTSRTGRRGRTTTAARAVSCTTSSVNPSRSSTAGPSHAVRDLSYGELYMYKLSSNPNTIWVESTPRQKQKQLAVTRWCRYIMSTSDGVAKFATRDVCTDMVPICFLLQILLKTYYILVNRQYKNQSSFIFLKRNHTFTTENVYK